MRVRRLWIVPSLAIGLACSPPDGADPMSPEAARQIHESALVVETHSDTTPWFEDPEWRFSDRHEAGHVDIPRMREGGLDAVFWSIYMGKTEGKGRAVRNALERIDAVYEMVERNRDDVGIARSAADIRRLVRQGKIASLMGVEGGHIIEDSLAVLRTYYRMGVRYMTLTHSFHTGWADSSGTNEVPEPVHGGLTAYGEEIITEMNRLGMMVDVSHVSDETFWDVLGVTRAPVLASHSSCRAVANHPRNMSDDMLRALAQNGGVIQINFYPGYIDERVTARARELALELQPRIAHLRELYEERPIILRRSLRAFFTEHPFPQTSLDVLLDHFDHAIRVAGPDHVGLGADWDGVPSMPEGMEDVSRLPMLTHGLLARGHPPETVIKVLGSNVLRVMKEAESVSRQMGREASAATGSP
jgi:membrane dipeptidase